MKSVFIFIFIFISLVSPFVSAKSFEYGPKADPSVGFLSVVEKAKINNKLILVVFGSDWCPDCRSLNKKMSEEPLLKTINSNYEVLHIDIGNWDKNMEFTKKFGNPVGSGIPSIAVLDSKKNIYYVSEAGEFASARSSSINDLNKWFSSLAVEVNKIIVDAKPKETTNSKQAAKPKATNKALKSDS